MNEMTRIQSRRGRTALSLVLALLLLVLLAPVQAVQAGNDTLPGPMGGSVSTPLVEERFICEHWPNWRELNKEGGFSVNLMSVPRLLLDSPDGRAADRELDDVEARIIDWGEKALKEGWSSIGFSNYSVYQDEELLSVRFYLASYNAGFAEYVYCYNFSLPEGRRLTDEELAARFGVTDNLDTLKLEAMERRVSERLKQSSMSMDPSYNYFTETYRFFQSGNTMSHSLYLDRTGRLCFNYVEAVPAGSGAMLSTAPLAVDPRQPVKKLNPYFVKLMKKAGLDPEDESVQAVCTFVGAVWDEPTLQQALGQADAILPGEFLTDHAGFLPRLEYTEDGMSRLSGSEMYLVVPRYKYSIVTLEPLMLTDGGELLPEDQEPYAYVYTASGAAIVLQNQSEIFPNANILISDPVQAPYDGLSLAEREEAAFEPGRPEQSIRYILSFAPSISGKDGSLVLPDEVLDGTGLLPEPKEYPTYDQDLFDQIMSCLPKG